MILPNLSASSEAPPTRHPSISGCAISPSTLSGVTDPPYWIRVACATSSPYNDARTVRRYPWTSLASSAPQTRPVPIAQTGSYAMTTSSICSFVTPTKSFDSCIAQTSFLIFKSYSSFVSPIHKIGFIPPSNTFLTFKLMAISSSWNTVRRSLCPHRTYSQPIDLTILHATDPVYAPLSSKNTCCAPTAIPASWTRSLTLEMNGKGGKTTTSTHISFSASTAQVSSPNSSVKALPKAVASSSVAGFIFQLPAMIG
mmetsp:Transcript_18350/g.44307  ORF Transcript_18350/g.44307 Transcript_18350/m.44307 type:complete len:255 (+) Transcript_18350:1041-1805(+)